MTLLGICFTRLGSSARLTVAYLPLARTALTEPTMMPRSLTSEATCSWLPSELAFIFTSTIGVNTLL